MLGAQVRAISPSRVAWALLAGALLVRLAAIVATQDFVLTRDPLDYHVHAVSIAAFNGYPESMFAPGGGASALRAPLYPYLLGAVYAVVGDSVDAGRVFGALLGVVTVALIGLVAHQLWGRRPALVAMAIAAVYPPLVLVSATLVTESVALPLMLGAFAATLAHRDRPAGLRWPLIAGLLLGLGVLARPAAGVLVLPVALALWGARVQPRRWTAPVTTVLVAVIVLVPWAVRNTLELDAFVPVGTVGGYLVAGTYNDVAASDDRFPYAHRVILGVPQYAPLVTGGNLKEAEVSRRLTTGARSYIADHPAAPAKAIFYNSMRLLELGKGPGNGRLSYEAVGIGSRLARLATLAFYALALLALAGAATRAARGGPKWLMLLAPLLLWLSVVVISGDVRYRLPLEPFVVWLAALAVVAAWERQGGRLTSA